MVEELVIAVRYLSKCRNRSGRAVDAMDVTTTVKALAELGVRVYCLALGADLTSSAGTMTMDG